MNKVNFTKDIKNFFVSAWVVIKDAFRIILGLIKKLWNYLKRLESKTIKRVLGLILISVSYIVLVLLAILGTLLSADPIQFNNILLGLSNVNLLAYVSPFEYYTMLVGGLLMDIIFWSSIAGLGWYLVGKRINYLREKILFFGVLFISGAFMFSIGLYYALPDVKIPFDQLEERYGKKHKYKYDDHYFFPEFDDFQEYYFRELNSY